MIVYTVIDINASACPIFCDLIQQKRLAFIAAEVEGKYTVLLAFIAAEVEGKYTVLFFFGPKLSCTSLGA